MSKVILFRGILLCSLFAVIFANNAMSQGTATAAPEEAKEEEKASEAPFEISGYGKYCPFKNRESWLCG
jgi:Na+-transporting methylmalonyl-CoA/oxaloacetate decarboxylase gamma subunit